jgi:hypothetical protein
MPPTVGEARNEFWTRVGASGTEVIAPFIDTALMGYPRWPGRPAYRVISGNNRNTILATDGLSDLFDEGHPMAQDGVSGFRLELYVETDEPITIDKAARSWQFAMLLQMAMNTADSGEIRELLDHHGQISIELYDVPLPKPFLLEEGRAGALVGARSKLIPASFDGPAADVAAVSVVLLHPSEVDECLTPAGRRKVADAIFERWGEPLSSLSRPPVI